jgi:hypothetical protein
MFTTIYTYQNKRGLIEEIFKCHLNEETLKSNFSYQSKENNEIVSHDTNRDAKWLLFQEKQLLNFLVENEIPFKMNIWKD